MIFLLQSKLHHLQSLIYISVANGRIMSAQFVRANTLGSRTTFNFLGVLTPLMFHEINFSPRPRGQSDCNGKRPLRLKRCWTRVYKRTCWTRLNGPSCNIVTFSLHVYVSFNVLTPIVIYSSYFYIEEMKTG
jgi:hypothetical protein